MTVSTKVLFGLPQKEIASAIVSCMDRSIRTSIITGFVTPDGLKKISKSIVKRPSSLQNFVVGAATYPAFEALDRLVAAGVQSDRLRVHLGHSALTGGKKHPFARYHPMMHSKIYYMEYSDSTASAFIGSHNVTGFALGGSNGEASVLIQGRSNEQEFREVRKHIDIMASQSLSYSSSLKEAFSWWFREAIDGMLAEFRMPRDWTTVRTILIFARYTKGQEPAANDEIYFELPKGIEQIESLTTEMHLFLFDLLPATPAQALANAFSANRKYTCQIVGLEIGSGNVEVNADWRIELRPTPELLPVSGRTHKPILSTRFQQLRARVLVSSLQSYDYMFDREKVGWDPTFYNQRDHGHAVTAQPALFEDWEPEKAGKFSGDDGRTWSLVTGLIPRSGSVMETDQLALSSAVPESGNFILVSLRQRKADKHDLD